MWDSRKNEFIKIDKPQRIDMEHSLISLSKWESKWRKPFITIKPKPHTREETLDYLRCMTINKNVNPLVYNAIPNRLLDAVNQYIDDPRTATTFHSLRQQQQGGKVVMRDPTSELIYAQMVKYGIPFEPCEKWHLNRLITLIKTCSIENVPQEKMSKKDLYSYHRSVNASRRAGRRHR